MKTIALIPTYDPVAKKWKIECALCGRILARSERGDAVRAMSKHLKKHES